MSEEVYTPIMLDLRGLNEQRSTGIVCGVAGRLIERLGKGVNNSRRPESHSDGVGPFNMSYLSTAKAGNVIVREDEVEDALEALKEAGGDVGGNPPDVKDAMEETDKRDIFVPSQPVDVRRH